MRPSPGTARTARHRAPILILLAVAATLGCAAREQPLADDSPAEWRPSSETGEERRPDIVVVVADDLDLRSARSMPFYQRLAAQGLEFRQHVTRTPVCAPSRASLLTGLGWERHGVGVGEKGRSFQTMLEHEQRTLGPLLQAAGYRTMLAGKYINATPCNHRPDGWDRWLCVCRSLYDARRYKISNDGRVYWSRVYQTDFLRDATLEFLREADERPTFVYLAPPAPHGPMDPPSRHANVDVPPLELPPSFAANEAIARSRHRRLMRTSLALGEMVEAVRDQLESSDRPWRLIFTVDNGIQQGAHGLLHKDVVWEESIRVPLVVLGSDIEPGVRDVQTIHEDVAATVLALAGVAVGDIDGTDLLTAPGHDEVSIRASSSSAVRSTTRKRITWDDGTITTFDLRNDPYELSPLPTF
ncbi:MAG TPA: sulfatase-like hydrolase/transferase [Candidatus Binatia bacterium]